MEKKEELEFLHKIKSELLNAVISSPVIGRDLHGYQINTFTIESEKWHEIFKTDEYNEMKNESLSKES